MAHPRNEGDSSDTDYQSLPARSQSPLSKIPLSKSIFPEAWGAWRTGVIMCAFAAAIAFLINTSVAIWATTKFGVNKGNGSFYHGVGTIYDGSCAKTESMSRWFHLGINALATILLSGSNYCMQCLVAPTREDIDRAHGRGLSADMGIPSMRNFRIVGWSRVGLWWCLAISSGPLHLLYNSAIFSSQASNLYRFVIVPQDNLHLFLDGGYQDCIDGDPNRFQRLEKKECIREYGVQFLSARRDVIVVVDAPGESVYSTNPDIEGGGNNVSMGLALYGGGVEYDWICGYTSKKRCDIKTVLANVETWNMDGYPVQYCLSDKTGSRCTLQFNKDILTVVVICNAVKCICMVLAALNLKKRPLITIGDAISSFLETPDRTTSRMCIATKKDFQKNWVSARAEHARETSCRTWSPYSHRWFSAASITKWLICTLVALLGMTIIIFLLCSTLPDLPHDYSTSLGLRSLWDIGFGVVDPRTFTLAGNGYTPYGSLLNCVLLANLAQLIMSILYLLYNSIFTSMVLADEWDRLSYEFKPLRVTRPTGEQRSSYFLSLPYKYSIPLLVASGGIHWLISQSIFLASVIQYDQGQPITGESFTTIGYSPIAVIFSLVSGCLLLLAAFANGFRRYSGGMPLVGSCSAAISAACHPGPEGPANVDSALQWGEVKVDGDIGHCTFSNNPSVPPPIPGNSYAGTPLRTEHLVSSDRSGTESLKNCKRDRERRRFPNSITSNVATYGGRSMSLSALEGDPVNARA